MRSFNSEFLTSLLLLLVGIPTPFNEAQAAETRCYKFSLPGFHGESSEGMLPLHEEIWCYQEISSPLPGLFIFNADGPEVSSDLSLFVGKDGTLIQTSTTQNFRSLHRTRALHFNPLPVPLEEPIGPVSNLTSIVNTSSTSSSQDRVLQELLQAPDQPLTFATLSPQDGPLWGEATLLPWRGYWWPFRGSPIAGPLAKYDRFVEARTGQNPNASTWERGHHHASSIFVWWEGHCNGWAAAAILRAEPRAPIYDSQSAVSFSISDQKAILSEADNCAKVTFFGRRYNRAPGDDLRDPDPALFHRTLLYYLGELHKPIAVDYKANAKVDTNVISAYQMNLKQTGPNQFEVVANLRMHTYDNNISETPGIAPTTNRTYRYSLITNVQGEIISGTWLSENPDFLWVPLGPGSCHISNPQLSNEWVLNLLGR